VNTSRPLSTEPRGAENAPPSSAGRQVKNYSGEMKRRLDIAASIVVTPDLLFLAITGRPAEEEEETVLKEEEIA
jgi:hypothetical protein